MPNIDLAVVNFHRPPLGTFHSKFMVVDRQIATVSSNNIQDNDNLEMMTHLEGPIVDSEFFVCLLYHDTNVPRSVGDVPRILAQCIGSPSTMPRLTSSWQTRTVV